MTGLDDGVVIVGASLAGLHCADGLRAGGFRGPLTVIGDEPRHPYDRTPLTKSVLVGRTRADRTPLALRAAADADWLLGVAAVRVDRGRREVILSDGRKVAFGRLVVASGVRARPWPNAEQAGFGGVHTVRTSNDGAALAATLRSGPSRVVVVGGGFIACEVASACSELGIACTLVVRGGALLASALGETLGERVGRMAQGAGVDVRIDSGVDELIGCDGAVRAVRLSTGELLDADVVVLATGSVGNVEWLQDAGLDLTGSRVRSDERLRAVRPDGSADREVLAIGDVSRWPSTSDAGRLVAVEHWGSAIAQGRYVARALLSAEGDLEPYDEVASFWSDLWGTSVKSLGDPAEADAVQVVRGDRDSGPFTALYGAGGRVVGAVAFDMPRELAFTRPLIEQGAPFPLPGPVVDSRASLDEILPAGIRTAHTAPQPADTDTTTRRTP